MSNIGQQLQEARSRQGYSIKEVADVIHIRPEYISKIEENSFDIPLHPVYIRGFVRLYSKFLKLDPDEIVEGYNKRNAQIEFTSEVASERESLGTFTLEGNVNDDESETGKANPFTRYKDEDESSKPIWLIPAGIAVVVILVFALIFAIKITFFPQPVGNEFSQGNEGPSVQQSTSSSLAASSIDENLIGLVAKAPVYVYVTQSIDNEILYSGSLEEGERKTIIREGEIHVACDKSENLVIEKGGIPLDLGGRTGKARFIVE